MGTTFYHLCNTSYAANPVNNKFGAQMPRNGGGMAGFFLTPMWLTHLGTIPYVNEPYMKNYSRTHVLGVGLTDSLKKDSIYTLSFWISSTKNPRYSSLKTNAFQAIFTKDSFFIDADPPAPKLYQPPHIQFDYQGAMVYDSINWVNIKCNFVAKGGERFMTIGCFLRMDSLFARVRLSRPVPVGELANGYYIFVDDVELYPATAPCYYPRQAGAAISYVPPVPPPPPVLAPIVPTWVAASAGAAGVAQGRLVVQHLPPRSSLWLYDALGQLVYQSANYTNDYSFLQQNAAMYFYVLRTPTQTLKGKILVTQ
jgi:hypothetical protein